MQRRHFELNAVDYLLKPFDDTRLQNSVERAIERISLQKHGQLVEKLQALLEARIVKWPERIVARDGERFDLIPVASIEMIESANNYVQLHCGAKSYLLSESLTHLESRLDPVRFIRIHRGRIINVARVLGVRAMLSSTYEVELRSGARLQPEDNTKTWYRCDYRGKGKPEMPFSTRQIAVLSATMSTSQDTSVSTCDRKALEHGWR